MIGLKGLAPGQAIETYARPTSNQELKACSRVSLQSLGANIAGNPTRVNADATAFLGERWGTEATPGSGLTPGSVFPAFVKPAWDGTLKVDVPGHPTNLGSPNFNEVAFSVDFRLFELDANFPESEPIPLLGYVSDYLVLRADGTNGSGNNFQADLAKFGREVEEFDPNNPYTPTGFTHTLGLGVNPVSMASGVGYEVTLGGDLIPFAAEVGKSYLVNYGLEVYANVTGAEGYAEADFFNTGTVSLISDDPNASFAVIPEPGTLTLLLLALCVFGSGRKGLFPTRRR